MLTHHSPHYRAAFIQYLRKGISIETSLEIMRKSATNNTETVENHTTHLYIWRTKSDGKVRPSHAENDGKVFSWHNRPETGYPGEEYGCRCWAEAYVPELEESSSQLVTSIIDEGLERWAWYDFVLHFYFGHGKSVKLSDVGHLQEAINVSKEHVFKKVEQQIFKEARKIISGTLYNGFTNSYSYSSVSFIHGKSNIYGSYNGTVQMIGESLHINAAIEYNFRDVFTDPISIRERNSGTSNPEAIQANTLINSEVGGQFYDIYDSWTTSLKAVINVNENSSIYR